MFPVILPAILLGYAVGSLPIGYLVAQGAGGIDLRRVGSGNVGATNVYRSTNLTTALAVMAMQDRREHPAITSSISWLRAHAVTEQATMALSLATLGLQLARESPEIPRAELLRHAQSTRDFGNAHLMAMALYALTSDEHGALAFKLS